MISLIVTCIHRLFLSPLSLFIALQHIMSEPEEITTMSGQKLQLKMSVDYISFSAHTDYQQTSEFIRALKPPHVVGGGNETILFVINCSYCSSFLKRVTINTFLS